MFRIILLLLVIVPQFLRSQDIQFSQFYANALYLNPAFAGSTHATRGIFHQRLQWPSLDAKYITTSISADVFFDKFNSGLGILAFKDWQGSNTINSGELHLIYSYELSISPTFSFRAGFQGGYVSRTIDYAQLTFPDQYTNRGFQNISTQEQFINDRKNLFDVSTGGLLYSSNFYIGFSGHHLTQPQQSFYNRDSRLPFKGTAVTGYKFDFSRRTASTLQHRKEIYLTPTLHYKWQGKSDQFDAGVYFQYDRLLIGGWYRGLPLLKEYRNKLQNNESVVALIGYKIYGLTISYSYDFTLSKLIVARTGGSHELNVTYVVDWPKRRNPRKKLPCPDL